MINIFVFELFFPQTRYLSKTIKINCMYKIIASGLGTGFSRFAPGTMGSILGILVFYAFHLLMNRLNLDVLTINLTSLIAIIFVLLLGVYAIKKVHKYWEHDSGQIVIDEIVGVWITALAMPFKWQYYLYALTVFRFFDIAKPLFIRKVDDMAGDWSVMLDDVLAGVYGLIVMQLLLFTNVI